MEVSPGAVGHHGGRRADPLECQVTEPGRIVVLNGAPRSGKSSIVTAVRRRVPGTWLNLGNDVFIRHVLPASLRPGVGLRPGNDRPDLALVVPALRSAMWLSIAAHAQAGFDVVADVTLHGDHGPDVDDGGADAVWTQLARHLAGLPAVVVGVRCPIEEIMARRDAGDPDRLGEYVRSTGPGDVPAPVRRWEDAVHVPGRYDLEVDTSRLSPDECADAIGELLASGPRRSVLAGGSEQTGESS